VTEEEEEGERVLSRDGRTRKRRKLFVEISPRDVVSGRRLAKKIAAPAASLLTKGYNPAEVLHGTGLLGSKYGDDGQV
jgi:hypothetical protein